jgi:NADH-quinone oxidoreductase subunit L
MLLPILFAMLLAAFNKRHGQIKYIAFIGSIVSLLLLPAVETGTESFNWFSINGVTITVTTAVAPLNYMLLALVAVIAPLVFAYSFGFIDLPSEQKRFYIELLAFEAAMLTFAMAGDFILLFIAWEFLSMTSYLLIGFWNSRERAVAAARKAITVVLVGDIALLASIVVLQNAFGTLVFSSIIGELGTITFPLSAAALIIVAIMSKSAQFPLHEWLPDAMEGPTPVSAFLHSTTMVKSGVFVAIVLFPVFSAANMLGVLMAVGAITVCVALFNAMREHHIKRVLAYSTVQELGLMLFAIGGGALLAAIYFFFAQSFYKALLFFSSGVAMKANESDKLDDIGGIKQNRLIYASTAFGVLALAGFIPFDGFFANVGLGSAFSANIAVYVFLSLVGMGTSFYIFRWFFMQEKKSANARVTLGYASAPRSTTYVMALLAAATLIASAGFFLLPGALSSTSYISGGMALLVNNLDVVVETLMAVVGAYVGFRLYRQRRKYLAKEHAGRGLLGLVYTFNFTNYAYSHMTSFVEVLAEGFAYFDAELNNWFDWIGHLAMLASGESRRIAAGNINTYVAVFVVGVLLLIAAVVIL